MEKKASKKVKDPSNKKSTKKPPIGNQPRPVTGNQPRSDSGKKRSSD